MFTIFFGAVGGLAIVANVAWQFYTIIISPINKHAEPVKVKRDDPIGKKDIEASDSSGSGAGAGAGGGAAAAASRAGWYQKIISKLRPSPPHKP